MHNNIMAAGSKDRPPMLGPGRYSQWRSRFLRYIDTKGNGEYLRKCIFDGPYKLTSVHFLRLLNHTRPSASTRHKGKEIAKPVTPQSESVFEEDSDPEQAQRDKDMQNNLALLEKYNNDNQSGQFRNQRIITVVGTRETVGSQVVQQNGIQCFNCKGFGHYAMECRKPKRVKDYSYHKEKMMTCKQAEHGVPLQAEQTDWLADMDEEIDEQELEAHYSVMEKIQEVLPEESCSTVQPLEQVDQNVAECVDERDALANLIANLTLDTEENKTILKQLKKANASLTQELEECKTNLDETSRALGRLLVVGILNETLGLLARKDIDIKEGLKTKAYEISVLNQKHDELVKKSLLTKSQYEDNLKIKKMHEDYEYVKSLEKEVDELESEKADFSNIYDLLLEECVSKDVTCSYLHSLSDLNAYAELQCLYLPKNGVVERRNRTLVEAARTMLLASKLPLSFWAKAVATACYTQNISIIISTHGKMAYHIINGRKPSIKHLHIFGCICYITRDGENLDKMKEKGDPCIMKASDYDNFDPVPLRQNVVPTAEKTDSSQQGLEFLFSPLIEEYYTPTHGQAEENNNDQAPNASFQEDEFINPFCTRVQEIGEPSSRNIDNTDVHSFQPQSHDYRWTRDHPLE
ncbi:retrovirus-related pol polyprotein from transposon TNT 1-94 [Tanacetum coccineum]